MLLNTYNKYVLHILSKRTIPTKIKQICYCVTVCSIIRNHSQCYNLYSTLQVKPQRQLYVMTARKFRKQLIGVI